ncbi:MAG TPA: PD-(D/E)XK nuclease family protein, partial [Acidimicrobiales bacterium]|nr:PD-(D/E)XK nuclease family protein [Acidimicrobiales bacterium]
YSGIVAGDLHAPDETVGSEPEHGGVLDEADTSAEPAAFSLLPPGEERELKDHRLPLGAMPGGTGVGTFVHRVLERLDFAAIDLEDHVESVLAEEWARRPVELDDPTVLVAGLVGAIRTPLGPLAAGLTLGQIQRADRLDEVAFELPLAGGDNPSGSIDIPEISRLFASHLDPAGPLRGYPERLASPALAGDVHGYLTGSLDLVFRTGARTGPRRYFVADYKTNRLGSANETLSAWNYRPEALDAAMQHAHYPLQAILYTVALHRYLRWRLAGYAPEENLGGVIYLFLRGMTGPDCPVVGGNPCGVFSWRPPVGLVLGLSDLFDRASMAVE